MIGDYKQFLNQSYYSEYKIINLKCVHAKLDATRRFEQSNITSGNLGKFFRYANSRLSTKNSVGPDRHVSKCLILHLHKNNPFMDYYFNHIRLEPSYLINDIGVDIDSLLLFDKHIDCIVAKGYSRIGLPFTGLFCFKKCSCF